ncbi:hypothetical protein GCM10027046_09530 [Uliginosibacterium flavum]|uniref:Cobalt transport protein n=1 Tax=Uliginosibacterium flavum TaxID=1396831 RepID=A0ABV2TIE2_9RHOO
MLKAMLNSIHPAVFVTAGFFLIARLQSISPAVLPWWAGSLVLLGLLGCAQGWLRIVRRMRYIFLALLILFAWQTPGILMLPGLGAFSPTWDGVQAVQDPVLRLLAVVSVVALMLHYLSIEAWVNSLYILLRPLRVLGFSPERFAVRLRLVLDYVERRDLEWRHCLDAALQEATVLEEEVWPVHELSWIDRVLLLCLFVLTLGSLL